ncbi:MAG: TM2 domain-containing protein [Flavobacteriales bacterium]|nr:MAG: TM2 domain-containing protein [Flavobacteriales bacterium]
MRWAGLLVLLLWASFGKAAGPFQPLRQEGLIAVLDPLGEEAVIVDDAQPENQRLMATLLTVALGPFGGHRLYMGTGVKVPIIYTLTLGGCFGILPLIDLVHVLTTKDLERYRNNKQVFMWAKPRTERLTPP